MIVACFGLASSFNRYLVPVLDVQLSESAGRSRGSAMYLVSFWFPVRPRVPSKNPRPNGDSNEPRISPNSLFEW